MLQLTGPGSRPRELATPATLAAQTNAAIRAVILITSIMPFVIAGSDGARNACLQGARHVQSKLAHKSSAEQRQPNKSRQKHTCPCLACTRRKLGRGWCIALW